METILVITAVCTCCDGTGICSGYCGKGDAVVCLGCGGTGANTISYTPFVKRKLMEGVECVKVPGGGFIRKGDDRNSKRELTYAEFLEKYK